MNTHTLTPEAAIYTNPTSRESSPQWYARTAGVLYIVIAIVAIIAHFYVPSNIIVPGDAAATGENIIAQEQLFRVGGIGSELIILLSEIVLTVILYVLFKPVNKSLSLLAAVSRLIMTTIHGVNLLNYVFAWLILSRPEMLSTFEPDQLHALASLFLEAHGYGFTLGIVFLTIHVFVLGYLIFKSGYLPQILGGLFIVAAAGYTIDSFALMLSNSYQTTPVFIAIPIAAAEIAFPLWLVIKGVNVEQWRKRVLESAE